MESHEIRERFLKFFESRGHKILPSSSLVPENDPSVLFTTAGMQQFKPYYTAPDNAVKDFGTKNVTTAQKCVRTGDIDEVGDDTHLTFFEMLGNFSFGGYWKKEAIEYAHEFITKELGLKINYVSVFEGDSEIPADNESREIWQSIDPSLVIKNHNRADNFWGPTGDEGPCGPTTEIYINGVEIWNIVFNEFYKTREGKYEPLKIKGIDTGMGLERLMVQVQKKNNVYETDLFSGEKNKKERIIADHVKTIAFLISDGVKPSNKGQGYVLRRLIRDIVSGNSLPEDGVEYKELFRVVVEKYKVFYPNLDLEKILDVFNQDAKDFMTVLYEGLKHLDKMQSPTTKDAFHLFQTYGLPLSVIKEKVLNFNQDEFDKELKQHQELSRTSSAGMFKGGLANHEEKTIKLHTAHHLLLAALQALVGSEIKQKGSNITEERLRMDFLFDRKLTDEEKKKLEDWVNEKIKMGLPVVRREMPLAEAEKLGAEMEFGAKYPEMVSVYFIEDKDGKAISKEFCGGPHVANTKELGTFKIGKEEAVSAGVRRIKAILL